MKFNTSLDAARAKTQQLAATVAPAIAVPFAGPSAGPEAAKKVSGLKPSAVAKTKLRQLNVRLSDDAHLRIRYAMNKWALEQLQQGRQVRASEQAFLEAWAMSLPAPPASDITA